MPLTGMPITDPALAARPALVVKIDNHPDARPQSGLNQADIVFELLVEGITRYALVFGSTLPTTVGPVRSARSSDIDLLVVCDHDIDDVIDAVDRAGRTQTRDHLGHDPFERILGHMSGRRCGPPREADGPMAGSVQRIDGAGGGNVCAGEPWRNVGPELQRWPAATGLERRIVGLGRRERVGFMLESAYGNQAHSCSDARSQNERWRLAVILRRRKPAGRYDAPFVWRGNSR